MLDVFSVIFVEDIKIIFRYDFVAPLKVLEQFFSPSIAKMYAGDEVTLPFIIIIINMVSSDLIFNKSCTVANSLVCSRKAIARSIELPRPSWQLHIES